MGPVKMLVHSLCTMKNCQKSFSYMEKMGREWVWYNGTRKSEDENLSRSDGTATAYFLGSGVGSSLALSKSVYHVYQTPYSDR